VEKGLTKTIAERICRNIANECPKAIPVTASIGFIEDIIDKNGEEMIQEYIKKQTTSCTRRKRMVKCV
jgi:GGDEF domain-containing protein